MKTGLFALWHGVARRIFFSVSAILLTATSAWAGAGDSKPIYLSYQKRLVLTYLLAGAGESEEIQLRVAQRLEKMLLKYMNSPVTEVKVKNFDEFLKAYKGSWPDSYSVESDLQLIEEGSARGPLALKAVDADGADNPALQAQIEGFISRQNRMLIEKVKIQEESPMMLLSPISEMLLKAKSPLEKRNWILQGFSKATDLLNRQLEQLEKVGEQVAISGKLANLDPTIKLFLETVLQEYFSRLGPESKKQLVSRFLGQNLTANSMEKFETMLMSAGPQFQKLLQVISGNSQVSADLTQVLKKLESKVSPIPAVLVQRMFEAERETYQWVRYDLEPLGTGTMAQVHKGVIRTPHGEQEVVIRFLKPEIEKRVREDERILGEIAQIMDQDVRFRNAGFPKLGPVIQDLNKTVTDELDLQATIQRQKLGREAYNRESFIKVDGYKNFLRINVPFVVEGGVGSKLMVQELVEGRKLDGEMLKYKDVIPRLGRTLGEQLARIWVEQAFYGTGFFHSDLHQGNYLVDVKDSEIVLAPLDFGMGGVISKDMQQTMVLLGIALRLDRPELVTQAIWSLSLQQVNKTTAAQFAEKVKKRMENIRKGISSDVELSEWMSWAMDEGIRFPYELVSLNRGIVILDQALNEAGSPKTISGLAAELAPLKARSLIFNLNQKGILTNGDLFRLGLSAFTGGSGSSKTISAGRGLQCSKVYSSKSSGSFLSNAIKKVVGGN